MVRSDVSKFKKTIKKYSDVIDVWRSDIYQMSSPPSVHIDLYVRYGVNLHNRRIDEAIDAVLGYLGDEITEMTDREMIRWTFSRIYMYIKRGGGEDLYYMSLKSYPGRRQWVVWAWNPYSLIDRSTFSKELGFVDFMQDNAETFQGLLPRYVFLVRIGRNGIGFEFYLTELAEGAEFETLMFSMENYLNGDKFNSYINNDEWIIVDDDFHVNLFIIMPNNDVLEYVAYKNTGYSVWEKYE